jgi:hypothetical protein
VPIEVGSRVVAEFQFVKAYILKPQGPPQILLLSPVHDW